MSHRRHDLLGYWAAHGSIDANQLGAGRRFERMFRRAGTDGHATIDPRQVRVDCASKPTKGEAAMIVIAKAELLELRQVLGAMDFALVCRVIGSGRELAEAGADADRRYLAHRIRDALGVMAARFALEAEMV